MTFKEWLPLIDTSENGRVTKKELKAYFKNYVEGKCTGFEKKDLCPDCGESLCPACRSKFQLN